MTSLRQVAAYIVARAHETSSIIAASGVGAVAVAYATGQISGKQAAVAAAAAIVGYLMPQDKALAQQIANAVAPIKALFVVGLTGGLLALGACSGGQLDPTAQKLVDDACTADKAAPAVVQGAGVVVSAVDPSAAPAAALANAVDPAVHAAIQSDCANLVKPTPASAQ